jgi:hypothetical protein
MESVSRTVASLGAGGRTDAYALADFASAGPGARFAAADGRWMDKPDALLSGFANGSRANALLVLSQPYYDAQARVSHSPVGGLHQ